MTTSINVLSLFDGMSCGQIAINKIGITNYTYFASEIEKNAIQITNKNYPNTIQLGDITKIKGVDLPKIDLLIGGSPCQGFSFAGKQLNFEDERSKLFFEYVRILKEVDPKYFLLENVKMKKEYQDIISSYLGVQPIRINSSLLQGVRRDRLYWTNIPQITIPNDKGITFDDISQNKQDWLSDLFIEKIGAWKAQQKPLENVTYIGKGMKLPCLTARGYNQNHSGMVLIGNGEGKYRYLSNNEAELAHGIPLDYTEGVSNKWRSHMIGNGWTVDVIAHIFSYIK